MRKHRVTHGKRKYDKKVMTESKEKMWWKKIKLVKYNMKVEGKKKKKKEWK